MTTKADNNPISEELTTHGVGAPAMSHRTRVEAAFKGERVDRVPVSFWRHFPGRDHTAELLAAETIAQQRRFDLDLVKLMPTGMYSVMDYGVAVRPSDDTVGTTVHVAGPIATAADWEMLPAVSPDRGILAREVEVVRLVRAALGPDTPILQTVFSPFSMAAKMVGGKLTGESLGAHAFLAALDRMADDVIAFADACLAQGADGFYFATQSANPVFGAALYDRLAVPYDLKVLDALRSRSWGLVLHLHGEEPLFGLADRYPVDAVSWEDRDTSPAIAQALSLTTKCLMAGVGRAVPLASGNAQDVAAQVRETIALCSGRRLIVAPGCVVPTTAPNRNLEELVAAARG